MTIIIMPPPEPPRREIEREGVTYREVRPGDDQPLWVNLLQVLAIFVIGLFFMAWIFLPAMFWVFDHSPLGLH